MQPHIGRQMAHVGVAQLDFHAVEQRFVVGNMVGKKRVITFSAAILGCVFCSCLVIRVKHIGADVDESFNTVCPIDVDAVCCRRNAATFDSKAHVKEEVHATGAEHRIVNLPFQGYTIRVGADFGIAQEVE